MCLGGFVAMEMALQLQEAGEDVSLVALLETVAPPGTRIDWAAYRQDMRGVKYRVARQLRNGAFVRTITRRLKRLINPPRRRKRPEHVEHVMQAHRVARRSYRGRRFDGALTLFCVEATRRNWLNPEDIARVSTRALQVVPIAGEHRRSGDSFIREPFVAVLAQKLTAALAQSAPRSREFVP
jgi:thioesterase domain-containing protein